MYPNSSTRYRLPFEDTIRVSSRARFILVRDRGRGAGAAAAETAPVIVRRSATRSVVEKLYQASTDYIIDQAEGKIFYTFNGHLEVLDVKSQESRRV